MLSQSAQASSWSDGGLAKVVVEAAETRALASRRSFCSLDEVYLKVGNSSAATSRPKLRLAARCLCTRSTQGCGRRQGRPFASPWQEDRSLSPAFGSRRLGCRERRLAQRTRSTVQNPNARYLPFIHRHCALLADLKILYSWGQSSEAVLDTPGSARQGKAPSRKRSRPGSPARTGPRKSSAESCTGRWKQSEGEKGKTGRRAQSQPFSAFPASEKGLNA